MTEQEKNNANNILWQTQEKCAELIIAISKYNGNSDLDNLEKLIDSVCSVEKDIKNVKCLLKEKVKEAFS